MYLEVKFDMELHEEATQEQIKEWLEYSLGLRGGMSADNPLEGQELEASKVSFY